MKWEKGEYDKHCRLVIPDGSSRGTFVLREEAEDRIKELEEKVKILSGEYHGQLYNILMWDFDNFEHVQNITCMRPVDEKQYEAIHKFLDNLFKSPDAPKDGDE